MVLFLTGIALGIFGAAIVLRLGPASEWLIWPIPTLVSPFAGVFYPIADPAGLDAGHLHGCCRRPTCSRACAPWWPDKPAPWDRLALGGGLAVAYLALACLLFAVVYRYAIRTGLIARYSAETVS